MTISTLKRKERELRMEVGQYRYWNLDTPAPEWRGGRIPNRKPERVVAQHERDLHNDPDRLDAEFLLAIIYKQKEGDET